MKNLILKIAFLISLNTAGCTDNSDIVVVYTTVDQIFSEPILKEFENQTGITVKAVYDTEETKSTGVLNRLIAEKRIRFVCRQNPHQGKKDNCKQACYH